MLEDALTQAHSLADEAQTPPNTQQGSVLISKLLMLSSTQNTTDKEKITQAIKTLLSINPNVTGQQIAHLPEFEGLKLTRFNGHVTIDFSNGDFPLAYAVYAKILTQLDQLPPDTTLDVEKYLIAHSPKKAFIQPNNTGNLPIHLIAGRQPALLPALIARCQALDIDLSTMVNKSIDNPSATPLRNALLGLASGKPICMH